MLEIEFCEPLISTCSCCGGRTTRLTRYVSRDGDAFAIYYAAFSDNHEPRVVRAIVSFGSWGGWEPGSIPKDRVAFAMDLYSGPDNYEVTSSMRQNRCGQTLQFSEQSFRASKLSLTLGSRTHFTSRITCLPKTN